MGIAVIPINAPLLGEEERDLVIKVLESGLLTDPRPEGGPMVREFERRFAAFVGTKHAVAVSSGTAALHAALLAAGVGPGDEVLVPSFTFVATANAVLLVGARPVFVDIDPETLTMDPEDARRKITGRTRAIIPVHLYGLPADMDPIMELAEEHGLVVIEDACQAHGSEYRGRRAGSLGHMACFSFYPSKLITTGEGGMITTDDDELAERLRMIRTHGQREVYSSEILGSNFRMTELQAAIGIAQMRKIGRFLEARRRNAKLLAEILADVPGIELPHEPPWARHNWYLFTIKCVGVDRDRLLRRLREAGIGAAVYYPRPIHRMPLYQRLGYDKVRLPVSERASEIVLSLPVHPGLSEEQVLYVGEKTKEFARSL